jgi:uncharacterized protein YqjF (DUF2071 family)
VKNFLRARWERLILLTYRVPEGLLQRWLPAGAALDLWEGRAHVSLVAFDFLETRVGGIGWPGMRNFPEINLRFYVTCGGKRGVIFVREFVPSRVISAVARRLYNEPYIAARMHSETEEGREELRVRHVLECAGKEQVVEVVAERERFVPGRETPEHFFKEHQWGFGRRKNGALLRYEVNHTEWAVHRVKRYTLAWNWAAIYGEEWGFLEGADPVNVMLAAGSEVSVMRWSGAT